LIIDATERRRQRPKNPEILLRQVAFILLHLPEPGSLLLRLAQEAGRPVGKLFGGLRHVARRLLDSVRFVAWEASRGDARQARGMRNRLDSS
jgi:hypothetical protein